MLTQSLFQGWAWASWVPEHGSSRWDLPVLPSLGMPSRGFALIDSSVTVIFQLSAWYLRLYLVGGIGFPRCHQQERTHLPMQETKENAGFSPWVRKIPWSRAWQPSPVFLPGEFHGQRSLVGYSPQSQSWTWLKQLSMHARKALG